MQHSRTPSFPLFFSSFKKHRSSIDQSRFRVNLTLPKPIAAPVWASLPTPPMSGSPPPESPNDPPQVAGRRRKRSETPPPTSAAPATTSATPPTPLEQTAQSTLATGRGGQLGSDGSIRPGLYTSAYPPPPALSYGSGTSIGGTPSGASDTLYASGQLSPRATRKTKAHVASACINCKKKHLRCDNTRPCRRCVQSGKEESCVDVEHKKRGRPPLKPEDPSTRRPFESALSPMSGHPDPSRRLLTADPSGYPQSSNFPRTFRPLQALPPYDSGRPQMRPGLSYGIYAPPSISATSTMAMGQFTPSARPYSSGQSLQSTQAPSPYTSQESRNIPPYGGYSYPPPQGQMGPPPMQHYSNPLFPRTTAPQHEPLMGITGPSNLQLPPIRPAPQGSPIDPALAQQQRQQVQQYPQEGQGSGSGTTRQPDSKRPKMDIQGILGPRSD